MIFRFFRLTTIKIKAIADTFFNKNLIREQNVQRLGKIVINGRIIIKNKGQIKIGYNVLINNSSEFNPVGMPHPTILCTQNKQAVITIGNNVGLSGVSVVAATSVKIGNNVLIGGGVGIWDTDFHPLDPELRKINRTKGAKTSPIVIEDDVFIGARAIILKGITIGKGAIIGAGAVISKNVPEGSTVVGYNNLIQK